jgi:predicted amidophosphoribosyltransferase
VGALVGVGVPLQSGNLQNRMPKATYARCKNCDRHVSECGALSHNRYCVECGAELNEQAARDLAAHSGPKFQAWRRGVAASVGAQLPEDVLT